MSYIEFMDRAWARGLEVLKPSPVELERGLALHRDLPVCDNYGFLPKTFTKGFRDELDALKERGAGVVEWKQKAFILRLTAAAQDPEAARELSEAMNRAGICGMIQNVSDVGESLEQALQYYAATKHICDTFRPRLFQATCSEDLETAKKSGATGVLFSLTGLPMSGSMADPDRLLDWVGVWYQMGVRFMHMGYNRRNYFADGCLEARDGGLSDFGRELVVRMNKSGIIIDVPHSSPNSTFDAISASSRPVIASHAGCHGIHSHPRCKTDKELKAIAGSGGLVGIFAVPNLLGPKADLNLLLRHVEHAVKTVGADHVAVGTDLGFQQPWPSDIVGHSATNALTRKVGSWKPEHQVHASEEHLGGSLTWTNWPLITVGLAKIGLSRDQIEKIVGGNLRRILRACRPEAETLAVAAVSC